MNRRLFILTVAMIGLVFLSGVGVGVVGHRAAEPVKFHSVLAEELDLSPEQLGGQMYLRTDPPCSEVPAAVALPA